MTFSDPLYLIPSPLRCFSVGLRFKITVFLRPFPKILFGLWSGAASGRLGPHDDEDVGSGADTSDLVSSICETCVQLCVGLVIDWGTIGNPKENFEETIGHPESSLIMLWVNTFSVFSYDEHVRSNVEWKVYTDGRVQISAWVTR